MVTCGADENVVFGGDFMCFDINMAYCKTSPVVRVSSLLAFCSRSRLCRNSQFDQIRIAQNSTEYSREFHLISVEFLKTPQT